MTSGKFFNRGVMTLDSPHLGYVVRETNDKIVVFGDGDERFDIPINEIQNTSKNVLIGLKTDDIVAKYAVERDTHLPTSKEAPIWQLPDGVDLAAYEGKYPKSLFNKGVRIQNEDHLGHIMKETEDKIVIFGDYNFRYDIPKSKIYEVGRNVILNMDKNEVMEYRVNKDSPLPALGSK